MSKQSKYQSKATDELGYINWTNEENAIWRDLYQRQIELLPGRACQAYFDGLELLGMSDEAIPQLPDIDRVLQRETGWRTAPVPALINFSKFFQLLADKRFPVATFIRTRDEFDYLQEPDIFHEIFGHCPLLTNPAFAHFTHTYGKLGLKASKEERVFLARLYWFTVEFGLVDTPEGRRVYGGGILSSPGETMYALESGEPQHKPLTPMDALRTPYRIDIMQPLYYVLQDLDQLYTLSELDLMALVREAMGAGLYDPLFPPIEKKSGLIFYNL